MKITQYKLRQEHKDALADDYPQGETPGLTDAQLQAAFEESWKRRADEYRHMAGEAPAVARLSIRDALLLDVLERSRAIHDIERAHKWQQWQAMEPDSGMGREWHDNAVYLDALIKDIDAQIARLRGGE